jgi:hypothetical protein
MGRTVIIGDVHGCRVELEALLDRIGFTSGDRIVFVGDLIARGPDSLGVLDVARRTGAVIVLGNHEEKLIAWRHGREAWLRGGAAKHPLGRMHREVARSLRPVDWTLLETSPLYVDLPEHGARVVHAGVLPKIPIDHQTPSTLMNVRTVKVRRPRGSRAAYGSMKVLWATRYSGPPHIVFGHNAMQGLQLHRWATGLDTACVYGGRLSAIVLAEGQRIPYAFEARKKLIVSIPAARIYFEGQSSRFKKRVA